MKVKTKNTVPELHRIMKNAMGCELYKRYVVNGKFATGKDYYSMNISIGTNDACIDFRTQGFAKRHKIRYQTVLGILTAEIIPNEFQAISTGLTHKTRSLLVLDVDIDLRIIGIEAALKAISDDFLEPSDYRFNDNNNGHAQFFWFLNEEITAGQYGAICKVLNNHQFKHGIIGDPQFKGWRCKRPNLGNFNGLVYSYADIVNKCRKLIDAVLGMPENTKADNAPTSSITPKKLKKYVIASRKIDENSRHDYVFTYIAKEVRADMAEGKELKPQNFIDLANTAFERTHAMPKDHPYTLKEAITNAEYLYKAYKNGEITPNPYTQEQCRKGGKGNTDYELRDKIKCMVAKGRNTTQIAAELGCNRRNIINLCKKMGLKMLGRRRSLERGK